MFNWFNQRKPALITSSNTSIRNIKSRKISNSVDIDREPVTIIGTIRQSWRSLFDTKIESTLEENNLIMNANRIGGEVTFEPNLVTSAFANKKVDRGLFIVLEGIDGSGKTTQCKQLVNFLRQNNVDAQHIRLPDRETKSGKIIDKVLRGELKIDSMELQDLFNQNRREKMPQLLALLKNGYWLVCDRYCYSGIVYGLMHGLGSQECIEKEVGLIYPDVIMYINITPQQAAKRVDTRDEEKEIYDNVDTMNKVYKYFENLFIHHKYSDDYILFNSPSLININGNQSIDNVFKDVKNDLMNNYEVYQEYLIEKCISHLTYTNLISLPSSLQETHSVESIS
jgi:dTMP kinase